MPQARCLNSCFVPREQREDASLSLKRKTEILPSLPELTKYQYRLLFLLAIVIGIFPATKSATAGDGTSQPKTVATKTYNDKEIPVGFNVERYSPVWERNPFTLVTPSAPQAHHSPFEKLFLTSWLKDGYRDVIFVQNLETNEVQKITAEPNQSNLRLIGLRLNPSPQLVEAVISDGKEQGSVKFRFDVQTPAGQAASPVLQTTNTGTSRQVPNPAPVGGRSVQGLPANPPNAVGTPGPANMQPNQPIASGTNPGVPGGQIGSGSGQAALRRQ